MSDARKLTEDELRLIVDPWRERACAVCTKPFRPKTHGRRDAMRAKVCSTSCGGKLGAAAVGSKLRGRTKNSFGRKLKPEEEIQCARCYLRGHAAGDPERCLRPVTEYGHALGNYGP